MPISMRQTLWLALLATVVVSVGSAEVYGREPAKSTPDLNDAPEGWASSEVGTTGGGTGEAFTVSDIDSLVEKVQGDKPRTIEISGTIKLPKQVRIDSNKTLIGVGSDAKLTGGQLTIRGASNIIVAAAARRH